MQNQVSFYFCSEKFGCIRNIVYICSRYFANNSKTINNYDDDITEKHKGSVAAPGAALPQRVNFSTISINRNRKLSVAIPVRYLLDTICECLHAFFSFPKTNK
jgi:hypothetical protein